MLVLAGVALSLVVGEDGVIGRAIKTRNTHGVAVAKEQIALKAADYGGEYYVRIYKDRDLDEDNGVCAYIAERLNGTVDDYAFSTENKMVTVKKDNETQAVGVILEDGSIGWNGKSAFGPANPTYIADFGKKVIGYTGYTAYNENDEWRLFYADNYCAYLIKNSIGSYALKDTTLFPNFNSATISQLGKNLNSKCLENFWNHNNSHNNIKAVAGLLNTEKCANYANNTANWAIGAPTVENVYSIV